MNQKSGLLFFLSFFVFSSAQAGVLWQPPDEDISLGHFPTKMVSDLSNLFVPENIFPVVVGGTATAVDWMVLDPQDGLAKSLESLKVGPLFDFGDFYGQGWVEGGEAIGSWILGGLTNNQRLGSFGRDESESLVLATITVTGMKYAVDRTRPNGEPFSFPSGHTITAFCIAPVINRYWGWQAGVPAYLLGVITAGARVEGRWHYLSDVIVGATLGIVIGNAVVYSQKDSSLSALPTRGNYLPDVMLGVTLGLVAGSAVLNPPKDISLSAMPGGLGAKWEFN